MSQLRVCFTWKFGGEENWMFRKKKRAYGKNWRHWNERVLWVNFLFIIQNLPYLENLYCIEGEF